MKQKHEKIMVFTKENDLLLHWPVPEIHENVTLHITQNLTLIALYLISYSIIYIIIIQYIISIYSRGIYLIIIVIYNIYKGRIYF